MKTVQQWLCLWGHGLKADGEFGPATELAVKRFQKADLPPGSFFLNRRTPTDRVLTGLVPSFEGEVFETIEGNTSDDGGREGYEFCRRLRGYAQKDFIRAA